MDFSQVKAITIPEGNVIRILSGATVLWERAGLPAEYQEVEYIESTGTQYINTGIASTRYITAHLDMQFTEYSLSSMIIIAWSTGAGRWFGKGGLNTYSAGNDAVSNIDALLRKEIDVTFTSSSIGFVIDGTTYSKAATSSQSNGYTMFAGRNVNTGVSFYASAKLYKATIQENGETIRDLVPCYRKIDKKPGLYDITNGVFYTNDGTGEFNVGADVIVLPAVYQRVEYLESSGTQYIDTGMVLNNGCVITLDFLIAESSVNRIIYGWRREGRYTDPYQAMIGANASKTRYVAVGRSSTNIQSCFNYDVRNKVLIDSVNEQILVNDTVIDRGADFSNGKAFNENGSSVVHPYLFALNNAGTPLAISEDTKIYGYSVQYEGELLQSFVPCYRKIDKVAGMYDLVNDVFYTNAGTGEFNVGPDIITIPSEYQKVEYIQSSGTQYIRTPVPPSDNFRMDLKVYSNCVDSFYCAGLRIGGDIIFGQTGTTTNNRVSGSVNGSSVTASTDGVQWSRSSSGQTYEIMLRTNGDGTFTYHIEDLTNEKEFLAENQSYDLMGDRTAGVCVSSLNSVYILNGTNQFYYFRLYKDGEVAFDGIPCYRKSDNVVGLYDLVSKTLLVNAGTGSFTAGPDV